MIPCELNSRAKKRIFCFSHFCVVPIETVVSAPSVALHHIAVFPSVEVCQHCGACGIRFNNDFSSHSSCRWIWPCARHFLFRPCRVPQYGQLLFLSVNGMHVIMLHSSNCATCMVDASCVLPIFMASSSVSCSFLPNDSFRNPGNPGPTMSCSINLSFSSAYNTIRIPTDHTNHATNLQQHTNIPLSVWQYDNIIIGRVVGVNLPGLMNYLSTMNAWNARC